MDPADLGASSCMRAPTFSPDGKTSLVGWGNVLRFFDAESGRERFAIEGAHTGGAGERDPLHFPTAAAHRQRAATTARSASGTAAGARELNVVTDPGDSHRLAVSPDGEKLASVGASRPSRRPFESGTAKPGACCRSAWVTSTADGSTALAFSVDGKELLCLQP